MPHEKTYGGFTLAELRAQVADNMADAVVGPLLDEMDRLRDMRKFVKETSVELAKTSVHGREFSEEIIRTLLGFARAKIKDVTEIEARADSAEKALAGVRGGQLSPDQIESLKGMGVRVESHGDKNQAVFNDWADKQRKEVDNMRGRMEAARAILDGEDY